jgi:hypothetical protein
LAITRNTLGGRSRVLPPCGHELLPIGQPTLRFNLLVVLLGITGHPIEQGRGRDIRKGILNAAIRPSSWLYLVVLPTVPHAVLRE